MSKRKYAVVDERLAMAEAITRLDAARRRALASAA